MLLWHQQIRPSQAYITMQATVQPPAPGHPSAASKASLSEGLFNLQRLKYLYPERGAPTPNPKHPDPQQHLDLSPQALHPRAQTPKAEPLGPKP